VIDDTDIAHKVDREFKFKYNDKVKEEGGYWTDIDEHLMVWYQMESFADFRKLYGSINGTLKKGVTYEITVQDNFDGPSLGTKKYIFLTELGMFGGKNFVLAGIFIGAACLIFLILCVFFCCYFRKLHRKNRENEAFIASLSYN
jgi:hypothetical protein